MNKPPHYGIIIKLLDVDSQYSEQLEMTHHVTHVLHSRGIQLGDLRYFKSNFAANLHLKMYLADVGDHLEVVELK